MLRFETDVRLNATASPSEISSRLADLVAAPFSFSKRERRKPLRGRVSTQGGFLRWPLNEYRIVSPRNLKFELVGSSHGSVLVGKFTIWKPLRIAVLTWLACGLIFWSWTLIQDLLRHSPTGAIGKDILIMLIGCCMALAYLGGTVFLGRKRNADLIRVLRAVLASEAGAAIVTELLSPSVGRDTTFVDAPKP